MSLLGPQPHQIKKLTPESIAHAKAEVLTLTKALNSPIPHNSNLAEPSRLPKSLEDIFLSKQNKETGWVRETDGAYDLARTLEPMRRFKRLMHMIDWDGHFHGQIIGHKKRSSVNVIWGRPHNVRPQDQIVISLTQVTNSHRFYFGFIVGPLNISQISNLDLSWAELPESQVETVSFQENSYVYVVAHHLNLDMSNLEIVEFFIRNLQDLYLNSL